MKAIAAACGLRVTRRLRALCKVASLASLCGCVHVNRELVANAPARSASYLFAPDGATSGVHFDGYTASQLTLLHGEFRKIAAPDDQNRVFGAVLSELAFSLRTPEGELGWSAASPTRIPFSLFGLDGKRKSKRPSRANT
jgi:hypothetical protein